MDIHVIFKLYKLQCLSLTNKVSLQGLLENEKMQKSLRKLENDLKEARMQKDKALHELTRLKQHLLEKVFPSSTSL